MDRFISDTELVVEAPGGTAEDVADVVVIFSPSGQLTIPRAFTFVMKR